MVLDRIPNTKIFTQRDVRETPASTATASAVGVTDGTYVTLTTHADLTDERVLTAGEGIDLSDGGAGNTITVSGEDATVTNKGIASFATADFSVTAGAVTVKDGGIDHDATANTHNLTTDVDHTAIQNIGTLSHATLETNSTELSGAHISLSGATTAHIGLTNEHLDWTASVGTIHADNYTDTGDTTYTAGDGLDLTGTVFSGENASDSNKGIASFQLTDFSVTTGDVALKAVVVMSVDGDSGTATPAVHNIDILGGTGITTVGASNDITVSLTNKTSYWSCAGINFHGRNPDTDSLNLQGTGASQLQSGEDNLVVAANVNLPHGAIVTAVVVYGTNAASTWFLKRVEVDSTTGADMATAAVDTEDTSITNPTIDNSAYTYHFLVSNLDTNDDVDGARITYTTDYI